MAGAVALAYGGEAKRAIDYGERALRLSPAQDRANYYSHHALSIAFFLTGRYEEAANAARRAIQSGPNFSISHCFLAAPLAKLGRLEEAKTAASRVLRCNHHSARRDSVRPLRCRLRWPIPYKKLAWGRPADVGGFRANVTN